MIKLISILIAGLLATMFYFPLNFTALPWTNSKMLMAVFGLVCLLVDLGKRRNAYISRDAMWLLVSAALVSVIAFLSVTINQTPDNTYVSYLISFAVWVCAAYLLCKLILAIHGRKDVTLVINYLCAICVFQCITALVFTRHPEIVQAIEKYVYLSASTLTRGRRTFGLGAMLDVGGSRFAVVLVALACLMAFPKKKLSYWSFLFYFCSFLFITIVGNMIARTTIVGSFFGLLIMVAGLFFKKRKDTDNSHNPALILLCSIITLVTVGICVYLYHNDPTIQKMLRFGFEGFFSLAEKGKWIVNSNENLKAMVVFPERLRTWVIGDGYFTNSVYDINYLGDATEEGFYMGTDIGYLRFIFYFGVIGLATISAVMCCSAFVCTRNFPQYRMMFTLALVLGFVIWFKVSTDLFPFFAVFLAYAAAYSLGNDEV